MTAEMALRSASGEPAGPTRVAALLPAATEVVCALGMRDRLVLRSHECDFPAGVEALPFVTEPKYDADGTSYGIDERIRAVMQEGLSIYRVDSEGMRRAAPDLIITQEQCRVCAVSTDELADAVATLMDPAPEILSLSPGSLADVFSDMERVAAALGVPERGVRLVETLRERLRRISRAVSTEGLADSPARPSVLVIEWIEPLMAAGNWLPELVKIVGGRNLGGDAGRHSPFVAWEQIWTTDPDFVVIVPCGFQLDRTRQEIHRLRALPGWEDMRAVRNGRVALVDGHHYFNRPGPRLVESTEILAEILYPDRVDFGHRGEGWEPLSRVSPTSQ